MFGFHDIELLFRSDFLFMHATVTHDFLKKVQNKDKRIYSMFGVWTWDQAKDTVQLLKKNIKYRRMGNQGGLERTWEWVVDQRQPEKVRKTKAAVCYHDTSFLFGSYRAISLCFNTFQPYLTASWKLLKRQSANEHLSYHMLHLLEFKRKPCDW